MTDENSETDLVRCEGCQQMVRPLTEHAISLVAATVVTVHACPSCGGRKVSVTSPSVR
jgi:Zn finger protein HypA/HybF involved in hydrogenase expression